MSFAADQSATDQALAKQWASMKAGHACFMVEVSAIAGAIPEVAGAVGAQSPSKTRVYSCCPPAL